MIIALKWLWMALKWPQMYVFWKYTQSNADSRFLMHNNKKSIEIDCLFGMIRVLRVFLREKFYLKLRSFQAKKLSSIFVIIIPFFMTLLSVTFSVFYDKKIIYILRLTRGLEIFVISKSKSITHFKMKGIKSSRNDSDEIISKWKTGHSFQNDSFA